MAQTVKFAVGVEEFGTDPSGIGVSSVGTVFHDLFKRGVEGDLVVALTETTAKAARDMKAVPFEDRARIRRPPRQRIDAPGEDSGAVGCYESLGI